ncbi:hypothetical protein ACWERY_38075 [Streptomyces sp. NPDC004082]|uniref:hypothetical protein n=1 Tax=unclassified Streptomyces TaxID=2593676 RepID=UPI0033A972BB
MRTTTALLAAAALLALTGCSSSDEGTATPTKTPSPAPTKSQPGHTPSPVPSSDEARELEQAVKDYTAAYFKAEASTAHRMLSERCRKEINPLVYGDMLRLAKKEFGSDHRATDVKAEVSGKLARVSYKVSGLTKYHQDAQPWAREGGMWKYDAC